MSTPALVRAGWSGLLAAALFVTAMVIEQIAPTQNPFASTTDYVYQAVIAVAFLGVVGAVLGLAVLLWRHRRLAWLGVLGAVLAGGGYFVVSLLSLNNLFAGERALLGIRGIAALVVLAGSALLGVLVLITRVLPWWCGVLLIVAFPLGDLADNLFRGGESVLLALLWGSVGVGLLAAANRPDRQATAAHGRVTA
jgi:hypothetical protein